MLHVLFTFAILFYFFVSFLNSKMSYSGTCCSIIPFTLIHNVNPSFALLTIFFFIFSFYDRKLLGNLCNTSSGVKDYTSRQAINGARMWVPGWSVWFLCVSTAWAQWSPAKCRFLGWGQKMPLGDLVKVPHWRRSWSHWTLSKSINIWML